MSIIKANKYINHGLTENDFILLKKELIQSCLNSTSKQLTIDFEGVRYFTTHFCDPLLDLLNDNNIICKLINLSNTGKKVINHIINFRQYKNVSLV